LTVLMNISLTERNAEEPRLPAATQRHLARVYEGKTLFERSFAGSTWF
jgi:hypothetical protein